MNADLQCGERSLHHTAFYDAITGPTEFIISIVNSVKMVNMPLACYPTLRREKVSVYYYLLLLRN